MARGKYASSAEARRAREQAEGEVAQNRRRIAILEQEVADLTARLSSEHQAHVDEIRHLNGLMEQGTSTEMEVLRERLRTAEKRAKEDAISRARQVIGTIAGLGTADAAVVGALYQVAKIYGVPASEIRKMDTAKRRKVTNTTLSHQFPIMESMIDRQERS